MTPTPATPLTVTCAWCQIVLVPGGPEVSHGICPTCRARVFATRRRSPAGASA